MVIVNESLVPNKQQHVNIACRNFAETVGRRKVLVRVTSTNDVCPPRTQSAFHPLRLLALFARNQTCLGPVGGEWRIYL